MSTTQKPQRLEEFAAFDLREGPFRDEYRWVIEFREVDAAGTPVDEDWTHEEAFECANPEVKWPHKLTRIADAIEGLHEMYEGDGVPIEVRVRLEHETHQVVDIAATEPWRIGFRPKAQKKKVARS